jgi:hypothetical protein
MSCILGAKRLYSAAMVRSTRTKPFSLRTGRLLAGLLLRP